MKINRFIWLFVVLVLAFNVAPSKADEVTPASIRQIMDGFGFTAGFAGFGERSGEGIAQFSGGQVPPELIEPLAEIAARELDEQKLLDRLESAFLGGLSAQEVDVLSAFANSPLGARITTLEVAAMTLEAEQEMVEQAEELARSIAEDPARSAVYDRMDQSLHASDIATTAIMSFSRAIAIGLMGDVDGEQLSMMLDSLKKARPQIRQSARQFNKSAFFYTYRDLSIDQLDEYAAFLETDAARQMYGLFFDQLVAFYGDSGERIGRGFAELMRQRDS